MSGNPYEAQTGRPVWQLSAAVRSAFALVFLLGALLTGSRAILAAGIQPLADIAHAMVMRFLPAFGGLRQAEIRRLIAATIVGLFGLWLAGRGIQAMRNPAQIHALVYLLFGLIGLAVQVALAEIPFRLRSNVLQSVARDRIAGALGSIALLAAGMFDMLFDWHYLDPAVCMAIAGFLLWSAMGDFKDVSALWAQPVTQPDPVEIKHGLEELRGIASANNIRMWQSEKGLAIEAWLGLDVTEWPDALRIKNETARMLKEHTGFELVTLHIDWAG